MRYGVGYQGSKNRIADDIIGILPGGKRFVDLFGGGFAMSHCALLSGKYDTVLYNELDTLCFELVAKALKGDYAPEKMDYHWVSREEFHAKKSTDAYIAYCWSFSNNARSYAYGADIEPWKKALWYARALKDNSLLAEMGINSDGSRIDIKSHEDEYRRKYVEWYGKPAKSRLIQLQSLESLERLQSLESLERLQSLESLERLERLESLERLERLQSLQSLEMVNGDYRDYRYCKGDIVYCDIPYEGQKKYKGVDFDHEGFYNWVANADCPIYFSSYLISDDRFFPIWAKNVYRLCGATTNASKVTEILYCNDVAFKTYGHKRIDQ